MTIFNYASLNVGNLPAAVDFYSNVFSLKKLNITSEDTLEGTEHSDITEVLLGSDKPGGATLILRQYTGGQPVVFGEVMLGFSTDDIDGIIKRVSANQGKVTHGPQQFSVVGEDGESVNGRLIIVADPEGHLSEVAQM